MRYTDIVLFEADTLEDAILHETFITNLAKMVGVKVKEKVSVVTNAITAAQVLYKVMSDPHYTESATFLLKKAINTRLRSLGDSPFKQAIIAKLPQGRTSKDFLKGLLIVSVLNTVLAVKDTVQSQLIDTLKSKILDIDSLVMQLLGSAAGGLSVVCQALGIGNTVIFQVLTDINTKIVNAGG